MVAAGLVWPEKRGAPIFYAQLVECGGCAKVAPRRLATSVKDLA